MSGTDATPQVPVPTDPRELSARLPEILRVILNQIAILEGSQNTQSERSNDISAQVGQLSQAQLTLQQAMNLIQSAHNSFHDSVQGTNPFSASSDGRRKRVMEPKLTVPAKYSGSNGPTDLAWRV